MNGGVRGRGTSVAYSARRSVLWVRGRDLSGFEFCIYRFASVVLVISDPFDMQDTEMVDITAASPELAHKVGGKNVEDGALVPATINVDVEGLGRGMDDEHRITRALEVVDALVRRADGDEADVTVGELEAALVR